MAEGYQATKGNVETFLKEVRNILKIPESRLDIMPREDKPIEYSTEYCLRDLGFETEDVKEEQVVNQEINKEEGQEEISIEEETPKVAPEELEEEPVEEQENKEKKRSYSL